MPNQTVENQFRTIIHIGLPRAASTYFQQQIFQSIRNFHALGPEITEYHPAFNQLLYSDSSAFDQSALNPFTSSETQMNLILSNELFCGRSHGQAAENRLRVAERLQQIWPKAEILIILRNQTSLLQSLYAIDTYSGISVKPIDYVDFSPKRPSKSYEWVGTWEFDKLVATYLSLFPHVKVYLFEDFVAERNGFLDQLYADFKIENTTRNIEMDRLNSSLGARQLSALRRWNTLKPVIQGSQIGNRIFQKGSQLIEHRWPKGKTFEFPMKLQAQIANHYRDSNNNLLELIPELAKSPNFSRYYALT